MIRLLIVLICSFFLFRCTNRKVKVEYYNDGKIKSETTYVGGKRNGEEKEYYQNGSLKTRSYFLNDTLSGPRISYYENGKLSSSVNYTKGLKNGSYYVFFKNGSIQASGTYKFGLRQGKLYQYYETDSGRVKAEGYVIIAENHEFLYYMKSYDLNGNLTEDSRTLKVTPSFKDDSIDLAIDYVDKAQYDSMKVVVGAFAPDFKIDTNLAIDTLSLRHNHVSKNYYVTRKDTIIRGKFLGFKTTSKLDTVINATTVGYFEEYLKDAK